jgi:hypothetical protein
MCFSCWCRGDAAGVSVLEPVAVSLQCDDLGGHRSARTLAAGHAFVQNLRRGHYELATDVPARHRIRTAFDQLAMVI